MSRTRTTSAASWLKRALSIIVAAELIYLVVVNGLLYLPLTQTVVNAIRPEKFHVSWDRAWTWYPFRVHARGISADGQSRSQQWQLDTPSASGSIAILPLLLKRVWIDDVTAYDIDYRQRPRLRPDRDYTDALPHYPAIEGREVTPAITTPRKKKRPWNIHLKQAYVEGHHSFWIYDLRGSGTGSLEGALTFETRGGPFSLDIGKLDLALEPLYIRDNQQVFERGTVSGQIGFAPFVPKEHKDITLLNFLRLDANLDMIVNSLAFVNVFTAGLGDITFDGSGRVGGRLALDEGRVLPDTELAILAQDLAVKLISVNIEGEGRIDLAAAAETPEQISLDIHFGDLVATHVEDDRPMATGRDLNLLLHGSSQLHLDAPGISEQAAIGLNIDALEVQDLALLQRYLPPKWPLELRGGNGVLLGSAKLEPNALAVDLALTSDRAQLGIAEYEFTTNLDAALKLDNPTIIAERTNIAGSYVRLRDSRLAGEAENVSEPWEASLEFTGGYLGVLSDEQKASGEDVLDLLQQLNKLESKDVLGESIGLIEFEAHVSRLDWIGVLLGETHNTTIAGDGTVTGQVLLREGWPQRGTEVKVRSPSLEAGVLDYLARGYGKVDLRVLEGGQTPDMGIDIGLTGASLKRRGDSLSHVQDADLSLQARIDDVTLTPGERDFTLQFRVDSATVTDMSVFNGYLPPDAPLSITGGTADLASDITLQAEDANGWLNLTSRNLRALVDKQSITGDLEANITLVGGVPRAMQFDVSGSTLLLDNVSVAGERESFSRDQWSATVILERGETTWTTPLQLSADARLQVSDTRPLVAMFNNGGYRPAWLGDLLILEDIEGMAWMDVADNRVVIPLAHVTSDKAEIAAKGIISEHSRDGVMYARYQKLDALLKISGGKKNLDIIKAQEKFNRYSVGSAR
jgi:hypothetical protein